MNYYRVMVVVCPVCGKVRRYGKWIEYEDVQDVLRSYCREWQQVSIVCPDCEKNE